MNRRKALKQLAIASGGLVILPNWIVSCGMSETNVHYSSFSAAEQELLASLTDTIIPASNPIAIGSVGALSVGVDKFLQKLIDDCYEKDRQDNIKKHLKLLEESAQLLHQMSFGSCTQAQRQELLLKFSTSEKKEEKDFYSLIRSETIRGFTTSQKVMEGYLGYKVAPGSYYGCVDVNNKV